MSVSKRLAIMFADIAGSTKLYETVGDAKARELTSQCIDLMAKITADYQGVVIKTIGDEVMCTFPSADLAAQAAVRMQENVEENEHEWNTKLRIRVGFHFGDVIEEHGDVFGDAVNLAARMAAQAKADQIITTGETLDIMSPHLSADGRELIRTHVKGKSDPIRICELTWGEEEELTIMGGHTEASAMTTESIKAVFQRKEVVVSASSGAVSMGRGKDNTFIVPDTMSSRNHAKIELRRGRTYLVDQSTNGTFVLTTTGERFLVHRDEHILSGRGVIGLGREVTATDPLAVHFMPAE
ncbi:MAG: FHA domain-containing protein [Magnetococcales bacterium]|nr:FHA domain-containing protein [Magnetococcales bacterium]MBF0148501.1 FHA domain-containing protein [Magnetococcales bacterium]MBF0173935.1 FHA domain-containing protein [Magnetococcales bacterium]MBF0347417.1 FHA domain-containing protein [Magnetococcales bacterium]MBF0630653.1 FHA domain-containing protein [Magnetococcales bacterium]